MERPYPLFPSTIDDGFFAGVIYHIEGEISPVLTIALPSEATVFFDSRILLWKQVTVTLNSWLKGSATKSVPEGIPGIIAEASGPGQIALSRNGPGHIIPMHLEEGADIHVKKHQFVAATGNIDCTMEPERESPPTLLCGEAGNCIDKFHNRRGPGLLWLYAYGNAFEKLLGAGESIDVNVEGWLYKDPHVSMSVNAISVGTDILASQQVKIIRFTGPGRLGLQSMSGARP